jgi:hypothetical protein
MYYPLYKVSPQLKSNMIGILGSAVRGSFKHETTALQQGQHDLKDEPHFGHFIILELNFSRGWLNAGPKSSVKIL